MFTKLYIENEEELKKSLSENPNASVFEVLRKTTLKAKKIGVTRTNQAIYEDPNHESHNNFTSNDRWDAVNVHMKLAKKHGKISDRLITAGKDEEAKKHNDIAMDHYNAMEEHHRHVSTPSGD